MEKSRPKSKTKKPKKKAKNEDITVPELPSSSNEASTSVSDEIHQAMQDITLLDDNERSQSCDHESPISHDLVAGCVIDSPVPIIETSTNTFESPSTSLETETLDESQCKEEGVQNMSHNQIELPDMAEVLTVSQEQHIEVEATAPPESMADNQQQAFHSQNLYPALQTLDTNKSFLNSEILKSIVPFTETQLAALYYNHEIDFCKEHLVEFIESQKGLQSQRFYEMLSTYLRSRNKLIATQLDVENLLKECKSQHEQIWSVEDTSITETGKCHDGNPVSVSHKYPVATLNKQNLNTLSRTLSSVRDLANEVYTLHAYSSEVLRLQIEHFIQEVLKYYINIPHNTCVKLYTSSVISTSELCVCISILFMFQRRHIKDEQFLSDTRLWLLRLGATLLRVATAREHLFLLHHILRSPGGITNWAIPLIQIPMDSLNDAYPSTSSAFLDHAVAFLSVLMHPIQERDQFIDDKKSLDDPWVFLDSDGDEEDETRGSMALLENDLVAILNQIPIDSIFRHILGIKQRDNNDVYFPENISQNSLLQLFSFATTVIKLLRTGLQTYNTPRCRQFAKRLGRLVRHTVQYVSDQWEVFRNSPAEVTDPAMLARLQVEYDSLLLRATQCIFSSQRLGAWQFLAVVPYNVASSDMIWCLFCLLHQEYQETLSFENKQHKDWHAEMQRDDLRTEFECKLSAMPEAEAYFLLNTFAAMALARGPEDQDFILAVTLDLFQVGFVSKSTQDSCSKTARTLLTNLTTKHPKLISSLLIALKQHMIEVGPLSLYLMKELPLHLWVPEAKDMETLSEWLLSPPGFLHSTVARCMLAGLDWPNLAQSLQLQVALLSVEACLKHAPERSGHTSPGGVAEGVSSLAAMVRSSSSPEQGLNAWAWGLLSRLRLHLNDRTTPVDISAAIHSVPDIDADSTLEVLARGLKEKEPIACFAILLATTWGHSIPLICNKGIPLLSTLLTHNKYDALCETLHHILPLFMDCSESLTSNDKFIQLFVSLITADRGYVKMAKNLLLADSPGPVLRQVANMIDFQFASYMRYNIESPSALTELWLSLLTSVPDWIREPSVSHLLDVTLRASHPHPAARELASAKLRQLYRNGVSKQGGTLSSLLTWVALSSSSPSLLPRSACPEYPWLALYVLDIEQDENEIRTGLWKQLLVEFADSNNKTTVDQAIKRAANNLKVPSVASGSLAIYRWAQQALDSSLDHPLLPIFWQRFFHLYLARVPVAPQTPEKGALGSKFFDGLMNASYVKKLRKRLHDASELYDARAAEPSLSGEGAEEAGGDRRSLYARTSKILRTFSLWLEEGRLQEPNLYLPALPPQYDPNRLALVISGDMIPWMEFVDVQEIQENQMDAVRDWQLQHFRSMDFSNSINEPQRKGERDESPVHRMLQRLRSYDRPQPAPPLKPSRSVVPILAPEDLQNSELSLAGLKEQCLSLLEFAQVHALHTSELAALDCGLIDLIPLLFRDTEVRVILTAGCEVFQRKKSGASECAGLFKATIKVCESRVNDSTEHQIKQNRTEHGGLLSRSLQPPPQRVCSAAVYTENMVSRLVGATQSAGERDDHFALEKLRDTGVALFYFLVSRYTEETAFYPPTKQLLTSCIEMLGQVYISREESQCDQLLIAILSQPHLSGLLSPHFSPQLAQTPVFLSMYQKVVKNCQTNPDTSFAVLSKFDIGLWLTKRRPLLRERSHFIQTLGEALAASGREPPQDRLILHEKFVRHLRNILLHDFPEHYGEILQLLLQLSESQSLCLDAWWSLVDCLTPQDTSSKLRPSASLKDQLRIYATQQRLLGPLEVRETANMLASYFTKERLQYGLHGLYPKYRYYIEPLSVFMGMIGHSLVIATLHQGRGALGDTLSEQIWPVLSEFFAPWLTPYTGQRLRQQSAAWIQQLTDDKAVLLPWTAPDATVAKLMSDSFTDILLFLLDTLPACSNILCFVWQFYITHYTLPAVKEHVLTVVNTSFSKLPWERFWPRGGDVDAMLKVVDQYLPNCHSFLGSVVFVQVAWVAWVQQVQSICTIDHLTRATVSLMHLLVKLAGEPSVRQHTRTLPLLQECTRQLPWQLVDASVFDTVLNWFVMSCDPRVILPEYTDTHPIDVATLELLHDIAGFNPDSQQLHPTTLRKRLAFVRACAKLLVSCASRYKLLLAKNPQYFKSAVYNLLDQVETINNPISHATKQAAESALLLGEVLSVASVSAPLASVLIPACCEWLQRRSGSSSVVRGLLKCLGTSFSDPKYLGAVLEETLAAFFRDPGLPNITWLHCLGFLQPVAPMPKSQQPWEPLEHVLIKEGNLLSLHALLLKRNPQEKSEQLSMLASLLDWMSAIKISDSVEHKIPILWKLAFSLALSICQKSVSEDGTLEPAVVQKLNNLAQYLSNVGEDRGWGLLGVIGLRKQFQASLKLRLLARTLAAFLLVQLPSAGEGDKRSVRLTADAPGALGDISSSCLSESLEPPAPSSLALQAVSSLEALGSSKLNPPELKVTLDQALTAVRNPENSLATFNLVYFPILSQLYQNPFLDR